MIHGLGVALKTMRSRPDEIIYRQGTPANRLYLIKKGRVALTSSIDITTYRRIPTVTKNIIINSSLGCINLGYG